MVKVVWKTICFSAVFVSLTVICKIVGGGEGGTSIEVLKMQNGEISGWKENSGDGYTQFNASNMEALVNGGAAEYTPKGLVEGFEQKMYKENTERTYLSWVLDFGTPEKATMMFNDRAAKYASTKESAHPAFEDTEVFLDPDSYGYHGYAHFGKYFVWMWFDNYGSNKSEAKSNLIDFLMVLKTKIANKK